MEDEIAEAVSDTCESSSMGSMKTARYRRHRYPGTRKGSSSTKSFLSSVVDRRSSIYPESSSNRGSLTETKGSIIRGGWMALLLRLKSECESQAPSI